ncbi:hypothetical protein Scep_028592 [Stephania cephalantha]|uniref:DYW domain-containing protein n=1 Tax=Stephania cephalantha TaxID=152367 RepID=A0AAP0ECB9_9MAGN
MSTTPCFHTLIRKCKTEAQLKQLHAHLTTAAVLRRDPRLLGRLLTSSAALSGEDPHYPTLLFSLLPHPTTFFYNTLLKAHSNSKSYSQPIKIYSQIITSGLSPDFYTYPFVFKACAHHSLFQQGRCLHGQALKFGLASCVYVNNSLIHFYSVNGCVGDAERLFAMGLDLDVVSWNCMISGYCGMAKEGLELFCRMLGEEGVRPSEVILASAVSGCADLGALELGKWVHWYLRGNGIELSVYLGTALVDMYAKCGEVGMALEVFDGMREKNLLAWSTMIKGLGMHGRGEEALSVFSNMEKAGIKPDDIAFIGILCACTHAGLVDKGREIFNSMSRDYGIVPKIEHYGCMVDLLARAGMLDEARDLIERVPMKPDAHIWGSLMAGCRFYKNVEMAEYAVKHLIELEPDNSGVYVLLSNIYAVSGRLDDARKVRDLMERKGVSKIAGCTLIEVCGTVHEFIVGDTTHPQMREIMVKWEEIYRLLDLEGYEPDKTEVLLDIIEEDKEEALARHSEKLAIAFGLISIADGLPIRMVKNLRVCSDCHHVTKLISKLYDRELIVRDRTRFHHFKNGKCSCNDYW